MKIAFVAFGELGSQLLEFAKIQYGPDTIVLFDDKYQGDVGEVHPFAEYQSKLFKDFLFFVSLGYKQLHAKKDIIEQLLAMGRRMPNLVDRSCFVSNGADLSQACYLYPMCNIDKDVRLRPGVLLNNSVTISHNTTIGSGSYLAPGVTVSGNVVIGDRVFVGSGSVVSNDVSIGNDVQIGLGSAVSKNIPADSVVIGNPMQFKSQKFRVI